MVVTSSMNPHHGSMELQQLRYVVEVADTLSFTRAAEQLKLPRATVSTAVQRLEGRVGARLQPHASYR